MEKTKKCPHCKVEVDSKASRCPHCHGKIYVWTMTKKGIAVAVGLIIILITMQDVANPTPTISPAEQIVNAKEGAIQSFARSYVKGILKSPTTAKFNYFPSVKQDPTDPSMFTIVSDVTSENSFGAKLTNTWSMKIKYIGTDSKVDIENGENYRIKEFYFDGEKVK